MKKHLLLMIMILLTAIFSSACSSSAYLELTGTLESNEINANSEVMGKIIDLKKDEGDHVDKNEVIAVVDSSMQQLVVKQQQAAVKLKKARLEELKAGTRPEQLEQAEAAVKSAEIAVKTAKTGIESAETGYSYLLEKYNKAKSLHTSGNATDDALSDAKYKLDIAKQQLDNAKKQYNTAQEQLNSVKAQLSLLKSGPAVQSVEAAKADLEQTEAVFEQSELLLSRYEIRSPISGTVVLRNVSSGDIVNTGAGIASISDLTKLWVSIYIPQTDLSRISAGQVLDMKLPALGGRTVKGKVTFISSEAEFTPKNTETSESKENTVFKVKVSLESSKDNLKPGMTADVLIPLSR